MRLRKLADRDAALMLGWMHDESVVEHLAGRFAEKNLEDCRRFISESLTDPDNLHLAVTDEGDEYMGTVSLKHICRQAGTAEFAITVRAEAMGKGYSRFAMGEMLRIGVEELGLTDIYWCVQPVNQRAVRFYDKCGYRRTETVPGDIRERYTPALLRSLIWYHYPA